MIPGSASQRRSVDATCTFGRLTGTAESLLQGECIDRDMSPGDGELMKPSQALAIHRERIRAIVAHYGGVNPRVFGSVARGEDTEDSDLDILVDDPEGRRLNLFALGGMNYDISSLIGRPVDVVPSADLPQKMRNEANSEAVPL
jgi:predicted nucleotidyltransferase